MRSFRSLARGCGGALLAVGLLAVPAVSQEPPADTQQAPQSQPAAVPDAYRLDIRNVLAYQVISTTRVGMAPPTTTKYREMVVFDIDEHGELVVCIGTPDLKAIAAAQQQADKPAATSGEHKPNAEEPEKVALTWKRYSLGKDFAQREDGTISFRPPQDDVMPYPVLPLPPTTLKDKERFDLTVPDLALGDGKTLQVTGQPKVAQDGKLTIQCRYEPKIVPGATPELAIIGYDIPAGAPVVSHVRMTRRAAGEAAARPAAEPQGFRPAGPHATGDRERSERQTPRPAAVAAAAAAQQGPPTVSVLLQLVSSKPVPDDLRKGLVSMASGKGRTDGEGENTATEQSSSADGKTTRVTGNLWDQIDQLGVQAKEKSEGKTK